MSVDPEPAGPFASIEEVLDDLRAGRLIVILDDEDRENEGDLVCAAELVTPEIVNFMATHGRGLICLPMPAERLDALEIPLMVQEGQQRAPRHRVLRLDRGPAARSRPASPPPTARARSASPSDPATRPDDLARPGHVFPLRARTGGVLKRAGPHRGVGRPVSHGRAVPPRPWSARS